MTDKNQKPGSEQKPAAPEFVALGDDIADMENELAGEVVDQGNQVDQESEKARNEIAEVMAMILGPGFEMLAPAWKVTKPEIDLLSEAYAALIEKYFPGGLTTFGVEINAALVTIAIIAPRMKMPRKEKAEEPGQDKEADNE